MVSKDLSNRGSSPSLRSRIALSALMLINAGTSFGYGITYVVMIAGFHFV
jgi:hypothetical protein